MTVTAIYLEHVLVPHKRRIVHCKPQTIRRLAPKWQRPHIALLNGTAIMRSEWGSRLKHGDVLAFVDVNAIPQGGGGGKSNPLQIVSMLAIMVFAPMAASYMMGGAFVGAGAAGFAAGGFMGGALTIGIGMVGMSLVNALIPPPKLPTPQQATNLAAASPTYNLQAQGNQARLEAAIPEHFGSFPCFPDYAAMPYAEYAGNEQYLFQLFCIGRGHYDLDAVKIEDSLISSFAEVEYEVIPPGSSVTLFPTTVTSAVEVVGQELKGMLTGTYSQSGTTITVTKTAHGIVNGTKVNLDFTSGTSVDGDYTVASVPTVDTFTVTGTSATTSGAVKIYQPIGPFTVNPSGTVTTKIAFDVVASRGIFYANDSGGLDELIIKCRADYRKIDDAGAPLGAWTSYDPNYLSTGLAKSVHHFTGNGVQTVFTTTISSALSGSITCKIDGIINYFATLTNSGDHKILTLITPARTPAPVMAQNAVGVKVSTVQPNIQLTFIASTGSETDEYLRGATNTPQRFSVSYPVASGRYEVRMRRTDTMNTSSRAGHELLWTSARAYLPDVTSYGDVTLLAVKMRASNNLSSATSHKVNCMVTRKLPIWNGTSWSAVTATSSIAWAIAYACKEMGLADAQIDLATLLTLDSTWTSRGDYFNGRFDNFQSFWEAVSKIAVAGRAKIFMQGGVVRIMRDQAASIPVALFSVRNIVKGSFAIDYLMPTIDTADAIDVGYFDKDAIAPRRVRAKLSGSTAERPVKIELTGVTDRNQAWREGMYQAACNRYRRRHIKFSTEMEGFIPSFGDLIAIQHDMPAWGAGGEITAWNAGTNTATLSEPMTWLGGTNYLALRKLDGAVDGPYVVTQGASANLAVFGSSPAYTPYVGLDKEKTHFAFGNGNAYLLARVLTARPSSLTHIEIQAVNEDANVHTADTSGTPVASPTWGLQRLITRPAVSNIKVVLGGTSGSPLSLISWRPSDSANYYVIETSQDAGVTWARAGESKMANYTLPAKISTMHIRIAGVGMTAQGDWSVWSGTPFAAPPANVTGLSASTNPSTTRLTWNAVADIDVAMYEIRVGASWEVGSEIGSVNGLSLDLSPLSSGTYTYWIKARDILKNYSETASSYELTVSVPGAVTITPGFSGSNYKLSWNAPSAAYSIDHYEVRYGASWAAGTLVGTVKQTVVEPPALWLGARQFWVAAVDIATNVGTPASNFVDVIAPSAPAITAQVIDNNVLLQWTDATASLPILHYEIRKGATWAGGVSLGTKQGRFTSTFESASGNYTYWIAGSDSAGNPGTPSPVTARVSQPPDYVLKLNSVSTFAGTFSNALLEAGAVVMPVNTTETFAAHFTNNAWSTPADQIAAGYIYYIEPTLSTGYYEETIDYGATLSASSITVAATIATVDGTPTSSIRISTKLNIGDAWTDTDGVSSIFATNFRYVKVRVTINAASGTHLARLTGLSTRLDAKLINDAGMATANSGDSGGTTVNFNIAFIDVSSITVSAQGSTAMKAIYDFTDTPYPTSFKIYLFDAAGNRATGTVSWSAKGY